MPSTLRGVIFDHTTLFSPSVQGAVLNDLRDTIGKLKSHKIRIGVFSTHPFNVEGELKSRGLPDADLYLTKSDVGKGKGSPDWIYAAATRLGIEPFEILFVGSDEWDWRTAINSATLYLHAKWVRPTPGGVTTFGIGQPSAVWLFVTHFLLPPPRWEYAVDDPKHKLYVRSLLGADVTLPASTPQTFTLQDVFTYENRVVVGNWPARDLLGVHALTSLYVEGRIRRLSLFAVYPSSTPRRISRVLRDFIRPASRLFHGYFREDLLVRGKPAVDSSRARVQARRAGHSDPVDFSNQTNTVMVNRARAKSVKDRAIVVFDDFTTTGMSLEWARNLLYKAGAREVLLVTIGKYPRPYMMYVPRTSKLVEPFGLKDYDIARDFVQVQATINENSAARDLIRESFNLFKDVKPLPVR